jgi:hypothetical protein
VGWRGCSCRYRPMTARASSGCAGGHPNSCQATPTGLIGVPGVLSTDPLPGPPPSTSSQWAGATSSHAAAPQACLIRVALQSAAGGPQVLRWHSPMVGGVTHLQEGTTGATLPYQPRTCPLLQGGSGGGSGGVAAGAAAVPVFAGLRRVAHPPEIHFPAYVAPDVEVRPSCGAAQFHSLGNNQPPVRVPAFSSAGCQRSKLRRFLC